MRLTQRRSRSTVLAGTALAALSVAGCGSDSGEDGVEPVADAGDAAYTFERPVELVVPFGPGGGADQVARAVGQAVEKAIDQQIPTINVPGATGSAGTTQMLSARPGSAMSILIQDTLTTIPAGAASFSLEDLRAVCRIQEMPSALMVRKGTYENFEDLAQAAKSRPGELKVATVGANSVDDIVLASLAEELGTEFRAVPFSEPSERYAALLGGQVDALYEQLGDVRQYLDSGDFVPAIIFSKKPLEQFDAPLAEELGLPEDVVLPQFRGLVTSAEAPDDFVNALSEACETAVATPEFQEFQESVFAAEDSYQSAEEFQTFLEEQVTLIEEQLTASA
jgi:tripartite-type tricarboxylate transporter receptor subunit TctC